MSKKKELKQDDSLIVDVDTDVTSVTTDCSFSAPSVELPVESKPKKRSSSKKKVKNSTDVQVEADNANVNESKPTNDVRELEMLTMLRSMELELDNAKMDLSEKSKELERVNKTFDALQEELSLKVSDNERLADELSISVSENKSLRKELSKLKQDYKKCQGDNRANGALVETLNGELTRFKVRNKELMETISNLQANAKDKSDEFSAKVSGLEFDIAARDQDIRKLEEKISLFGSMRFVERLKFLFTKSFKA